MVSRVPDGYWRDLRNRQKYLRWLGEKLGYRKPEDWYSVTGKDFRANHGSTLLKTGIYNGSVLEAARERYPYYDWVEWRFTRVGNTFWRQKNNRIRYLTWLGTQLGFSEPESWYGLKKIHFQGNHGLLLIDKYYRSSPFYAVKELFPKQKWLPWKFVGGVPDGYWDHRENIVRYLRWLGKQLGFKKITDWYRVTQKDFYQHFGSGLVTHTFGNSTVNVVRYLYPNRIWLDWKFASAPNAFWHEKENRHRYLRWLGCVLGYERNEDWYKLMKMDFDDNYGNKPLAQYYKSNPVAYVKEVLPDEEWHEWLFSTVPDGFWKNKENQVRYMEWLGQRLGYKESTDWYAITAEDFIRNNRRGVYLTIFKSSPSLGVMMTFPNFPWVPEKFHAERKMENLLYETVKSIFPADEVRRNFRHPDLVFQESGRRMELDVWIPSKQIALEYQGSQHVMPRKDWEDIAGLVAQQRRDKEKMAACKKAGIRLYEVPYTWDGQRESVLSIIGLDKRRSA